MIPFVFQQEQSQLAGFNQNLKYDNTEGNRPGKLRFVDNTDGSQRIDVWLKNETGGALTAGRPYMVKYGTLRSNLVQVKVPVTNTILNNFVVIAIGATASLAWGWFAIAGQCESIVSTDGTPGAIVAGDPLEVINAGTALIKDATAGFGQTVGYALSANPTGVSLQSVFLPGVAVAVAAT